MTVIQLAFDISADPVYRWENFFISSSNAEAISWVYQWPDWYSRALIVCGPRHSGKTHIAHLWRGKSDARFAKIDHILFENLAHYVKQNPFLIVEDICQESDETKLLHLYNLIQEHEGYLLLTTRTPPNQWRIRLSDLASRLKSMPLVTLHQPDDELLKALIIKRFSDCQLRVAGKVVDYLVKHMERSYEAVEELCLSLDRQSLEQKRGLTLPFAREVLLLK